MFCFLNKIDGCFPTLNKKKCTDLVTDVILCQGIRRKLSLCIISVLTLKLFISIARGGY